MATIVQNSIIPFFESRRYCSDRSSFTLEFFHGAEALAGRLLQRQVRLSLPDTSISRSTAQDCLIELVFCV
jgi:hypothetical protein